MQSLFANQSALLTQRRSRPEPYERLAGLARAAGGGWISPQRGLLAISEPSSESLPVKRTPSE